MNEQQRKAIEEQLNVLRDRIEDSQDPDMIVILRETVEIGEAYLASGGLVTTATKPLLIDEVPF